MSECPWCGAGIQTIIDDVPHYDCGSLGGEDAWQSRMCMRAERVSLKARNAELLAAHDELARALFRIRSITMRKLDYIEVANIACDAVLHLDESPFFPAKATESEGER